MLTWKIQKNLRNAKKYFEEHLKAGEYYSQEQQVLGEWIGQGAERLGLSGVVKEQEFLQLCEGKNPFTGEKLTQRKKGTREEEGKNVQNRRVFFDFTIAPPKSISLVGLMQDEKVLNAHRESVKACLAELEKYVATRVRKDGKNEDRRTGNFLTALFEHDSSRELDPHFHTHCIIFNATFDKEEESWKAVQPDLMIRAKNYVSNYYYHVLAQKLISLGYSIEHKREGFEIRGISEALNQKFSKRHTVIDREMMRRVLTRGMTHRSNNDMRAQIASDTRQRKVNTSLVQLRRHWKSQLDRSDKKSLKSLRKIKSRELDTSQLENAFEWAEKQVFERKSVVNDFDIWQSMLEWGRGQDFTLEELKSFFAQTNPLVYKENHIVCKEALQKEKSVVRDIRSKKMQYEAFTRTVDLSGEMLSEEQKHAVLGIWHSRDFAVLLDGKAGTGKSFTLKRIYDGIKENCNSVFVVAPQNQQVKSLEADGLPAQTLTKFLQKGRMPENSVLILDEAGQVGVRDMFKLFHIAKSSNSRILLSGDTQQHGAVESSDALLAIKRYGEINTFSLNFIRRQDASLAKEKAEKERIEAYKEAVKCAAHGKSAESLILLEKNKWIHEVEDSEMRLNAICEQFLKSTETGETGLIVTQTWNEIHAINKAVREKLKGRGDLDSKEEIKKLFCPKDFTLAEREEIRYFQKGEFVHFIKKYGAIRKGEICEIVAKDLDTGKLHVRRPNGEISKISPRSKSVAEKIQVLARLEVPVGIGEKIQLRSNGFSVDKQKYNNGEIVKVSKLNEDGTISVVDAKNNEKILSEENLIGNYGYAVTSYASQGKTVDRVIFADSGEVSATNQRQWYVSISRGRKSVSVFTEDLETLRQNLQKAGNKLLALDTQNKNFEKEEAGSKPIQKPRPNREKMLIEQSRSYYRWKEQRGRNLCQSQKINNSMSVSSARKMQLV